MAMGTTPFPSWIVVWDFLPGLDPVLHPLG
jgi:hypothetical protein